MQLKILAYVIKNDTLMGKLKKIKVFYDFKESISGIFNKLLRKKLIKNLTKAYFIVPMPPKKSDNIFFRLR